MTPPVDARATRAEEVAAALTAAESVPPREGGDEEENFLWAVSYSDLLMVLLCFFMIYFQFDDLARVAPRGSPEARARSSETLAGAASATSAEPDATAESMRAPAVATNPPSGAEAVAPEAARDSAFTRLCRALEPRVACKGTTTEAAIVLELPDGIFARGAYVPTDAAHARLEELARAWRDLPAGASLTVIGHADSVPLGDRTARVVGTNVALAALRASKAANLLVRLGVPENAMFAQGANNASRNARSLSIVVTLPGGTRP